MAGCSNHPGGKPFLSRPASIAWRVPILLTVATIGLVLAFHAPTLRSMVAIWAHNASFAHGFFVAPMAAFLAWTNRRRLALLEPAPSRSGIGLAALSGLAWVLAHGVGVQVGEQAALVAMVLGVVWGLLGTRVARATAFPLGFLFFAVPFGESLFPILIHVTAKMAVLSLALVGIPVALEGNYIRLPGAEWVVSETCSGLRFLLVILTVGSVYAYLTYSKPSRRVAFLALCVLFAILANGLRVWIIVMVGYATDMRSPLVWSHAWLGWVLFGAMTAALFLVGNRWGDRDSSAETPGASPVGQGAADPARGQTRFWVAASALAVISAGWVGLAGALEGARPPSADRVALPPLSPGGGWNRLSFRPWEWKPHYGGARAAIDEAFEKDGRIVCLYVGYYRGQRQGNEMIQATNSVVRSTDPFWRISAEGARVVPLRGRRLRMAQLDIRSPAGKLRVWRWYWVGGKYLTSDIEAKWVEFLSRVSGAGDDAAVLILASPYREDPERATADLADFLAGTLPSLERTLAGAARARPG